MWSASTSIEKTSSQKHVNLAVEEGTLGDGDDLAADVPPHARAGPDLHPLRHQRLREDLAVDDQSRGVMTGIEQLMDFKL